MILGSHRLTRTTLIVPSRTTNFVTKEGWPDKLEQQVLASIPMNRSRNEFGSDQDQRRSVEIRSTRGGALVGNEVKSSKSVLVATVATFLASAPMLAVPAAAEPESAVKWGHPGKVGDVSRSIEIETKEIGFGRKSIEVRDGETVRFVIRNTGQMVHDFAIGPAEAQARRRAQVATAMSSGMMDTGRMPGGLTQTAMSGSQTDPDRSKPPASGHSAPNAMLIHRGETRELIWSFSRAQDLEFACNMPGHYSMMRGKFVFVD